MLPEEIIKDDIAVLREEQMAFIAQYHYNSPAIQTQIDIRVKAARERGIEA